MRVAIFPGHVGKDPGAIDVAGGSDRLHTVEASITAAIAARVQHCLLGTGVEPVMCYGDWESRLEASAGCHVGISIHADSFHDNTKFGYHCIYYPRSVAGKALALTLNDTLNTVALRNRYPHSSNMKILRDTTFPCCIIEVGFLTNTVDEGHLHDPNYQSRLALAISWGALKYLYNKG